MEKPLVSVVGCREYEPRLVQASVGRAVDALGGMSAFVRPGDTVLIKPNMLSARPPEKAVTTHPEVVRSVVRLVREAGGRPVIADSQALGAFSRVASVTGMAAVADAEGAGLVELDEAREVRGWGTFRRFEVAAAVLDADVVINLPKAKTHGQMLLTLAVKNLFGCIPGRRKAQWHFKSGVDRDSFATMLVELCGIVAPALSIVDAVVGMEGNGPGGGTPRHIGLIAAGANTHALDMVLCKILGVPHGRLPTLRAARKAGIVPEDPAGIAIAGDFEAGTLPTVERFALPAASSLEWTIPEPVRRLLKDALTSRPGIDRSACELCMMCSEACPAGVIRKARGGLEINYRDCIRCFCCQEVCPVGAISLVEGWLIRYLG